MRNEMISVIIPIKKASGYLINENLPAFNKQIYKNFEVIVVCDVFIQQKYKWLKILKYSGTPSEKRNFGVKKAKGKILAFIDDDAYPEKNWLKNIIILQKNTITAVCGPGILPPNATFTEKVFDAVLTSKLGSASFTYRFQKENARFIDDFPLMNFAIIKSAYKEFGGLLNHWPGEDSKLCQEIVNAGYKIKYFPKIVVYHHRKNNLIEFLRQHSRYGFQRGSFFLDGDKNSRKIIYILPSLFLIYIFLLPLSLFSTKSYFLLLPLFLYLFCLIIFFDFQILKRRGLLLSSCSAFITMFLHLTYAVFFIKGCACATFKQKS